MSSGHSIQHESGINSSSSLPEEQVKEPSSPYIDGFSEPNPEEQQKEITRILLRKLDFRLIPWLAFLYFLSYLDRSNLGNAHDPIVEDLKLSEEQFAFTVSAFYIGYITFEIPSNLILKKSNPAYWIGCLVLGWGICSTCMGFVQDFKDLLILRIFLGITESGFFPGVVYYLSRWYQPEEQSTRISLFYCSSAISGVVSGLLASGFLQMRDILGLENWRWLFFFEGIPSIICGMLTWYVLPSAPHKISSLTEAERQLASRRLYHIKDDGKKVNAKDVWKTLLSLRVWGFALLYLTLDVPGYARAFYAPAIISAMGYTTVEANLLTSLLAFAGFILIATNGWHADRSKERPFHVIIPMVIALMGFVTLTLATYYDIPQLGYASLFLCYFQGCCLPILLSWMNSTMKSSTEIAIASATLLAVGNLGGIIGPNLYGFLFIEPEEGEEEGSYVIAHFAMVISLGIGLILVTFLKIFVPSEFNEHKEEDFAESKPLLKQDDFKSL